MKCINIKRLTSLFAVILCLSAVLPMTANDWQTNDTAHMTDTASLMIGDKFVGGWSYTVEGAPEGYQNGLLVIVKEGDSYKVQVQIGGGTLLGENVMVKGSTITFDVMVEGGKVAVALTAKGDTLTGTSTSAEGALTINGKKTISME